MKEYNIKRKCEYPKYCLNNSPITAKSKKEALEKFSAEHPQYARAIKNGFFIAEIIYPDYDPQ